MGAKHVSVCRTDVAGFLADNDSQGIGLLADALCGTMSESKFFGDVEVVTDRQDAGCCGYPAFCHNHGTVVKRTVLEEDVLDESLGYLAIDLFSGTDELAQGKVVLQHDERSDPLLAHVHACHHDREDGFAFISELAGLLVLVQTEEAEETMGLFSGSKIVEEATDVFLEEDDDGKDAYTHQLVEDSAKQFHLQHLADNDPAADEKQYTIEDVHRARLLHQLIAVEKHYRYKKDVYYVLEANVWHLGLILNK